MEKINDWSCRNAGNESLEIIPGNSVAVIYKSKWYVGQVLQLENSDDTYFVTFLETADRQNRKFKYHSSPDELWINTKAILCVIEERTAVGKIKRTVKTTQITANMIQRKFDKLA